MNRRAASILALAVLQAACSTAPPSARVAERADAVIDELVASTGFSGAVVLMRDGQVVYERAVGLAQRDPDRPFTVDTPSDGGSLAKTLTAAAVWQLVAEGRLALDTPVRSHLPEYPHAEHRLRDLITHRNGLPDYDAFESDFAPGQVRTTADLLRALARKSTPPTLPPGVRVEYSNLGFDTAALIVERVTGQPIETWWRERYFKPLGLNGMFARPARFADWPVPRTPGYRRKADGWALYDAYDGEGFIGASNVHASARDWARWGDAFARERVMPAALLDDGLRRPMLDSGMDNRLNLLSWYCDAGQRRCHYTGAYNAFFSQVHWDRGRREVVAYVSNSTLPPWRCAALTRDLIDALAGRVPAAETATARVPIAASDLARWAGRFEAAELAPLVITVQGGRAFVRVGAGERSSLFQVARDVFYAPTLDLWLAFSGTPEAATLHIRSVFIVADARRQVAGAGRP